MYAADTEAFKDTENLYNRPRLIFGPTSEPLHGAKSIQSVNNVEWKERKKLLHGMVRGQRLTSFIGDFVQVAHELEIQWCAASSTGNSVNLKKCEMDTNVHLVLRRMMQVQKKQNDTAEKELLNRYPIKIRRL